MHDALGGVLLALTIVIGVGVVILIVVLLALASAAFKTRKRIHQILDQYEGSIAPHIGPMVKSAHQLIDEVSPKLKHITANLSDVSDTLRSQTQHISASLGDVVDRTHEQAARVDTMVSGALNGIGYAASAVQEGIAIPIRRISGVFDGLRAGVSSLRRRKGPRQTYKSSETAIVRKVDPDPL